MGKGDCIFCMIVGGRIPAKTIYADADVIAFMDINPVAKGHVLVVPRTHAEYLWQLSSGQISAVGAALARLTLAVKEAVGAEGVNVLQNNGRIAGQLVPHVHFHLIPRFPGDEFQYTWPARKAPEEELDELMRRIAGRAK